MREPVRRMSNVDISGQKPDVANNEQLDQHKRVSPPAACVVAGLHIRRSLACHERRESFSGDTPPVASGFGAGGSAGSAALARSSLACALMAVSLLTNS